MYSRNITVRDGRPVDLVCRAIAPAVPRDSASAPVAEGRHPAVLSRIRDPGVALAIWHRRAPSGLARWLDSLPAERLPEGRFAGPVKDVPDRLSMLCDLVGLGDDLRRCALIDDIARLARLFAALTGNDDLDLRLEALDHDSCWRFHRDHVGYRINATYRGPGTQWLPARLAGRAVRAQRRYRGDLNELPRFAVGLFKGAARVGDQAVVHRSPPVEGSGVTRLFLCLNEVSDEL